LTQPQGLERGDNPWKTKKETDMEPEKARIRIIIQITGNL
jgi:hypothetical protein